MFGKNKTEELERRLTELERRLASHEANDMECRNFTVYEDRSDAIFYTYFPKSQSIGVKDVVRKILDHLGMKLVYVEGKPTAVDVQKKPKC